MSTYVLIHGGSNNGSVWKDVVPLLTAEGHEVFTPTLSGPEDTGLEDNIVEVCDLITTNNLEDVILVGHSYAAMVITGVADNIPELVKHLVYIDSVVPENSKSLYGMIEECGMDIESHGLLRYRPFVEPLFFDEATIRKIPKTYIHCTRSEFIAVGKPFFELVKRNAERDNWDHFEIDSKHHCMDEKPNEVAKILLGV